MPDKTHSVGLRIDDDTFNKLEELADELNLSKTQVFLRSFTDYFMHHHTNIMSNCMVVPKKLFSEMIQKLPKESVRELAIDAGISLANRFKLDIHKLSSEMSKEELIKYLLDYFEFRGFNWFSETHSFLTEDGTYKLQILHDFNEIMSFYSMIFISEAVKEAFNLQFKESKLSDETIELEFE
jgi:hypothetical protein